MVGHWDLADSFRHLIAPDRMVHALLFQTMIPIDAKQQADQGNDYVYGIVKETQDVEHAEQIDDAQYDDISCSSSPSTLLTANTFIPTPSKELIKSNIANIKSVKQVNVSISESKSTNIIATAFSCEATCLHQLTYKLQHRDEDYRQFDLDKLDVVLNPSGVLKIQCTILLNGLEGSLDYPSWLQVIFDNVMQKCRFKPANKQNEEKGLYHYQVEKAFVTTPISYVLDKQAPYGTLDTLEVLLDFSSPKTKEFHANWKRKLTLDIMSDYMEEVLIMLLIKKTCHLYPLIFSSAYAKRLTQSLPYLPHIARSLQQIYVTSRSTMSVTNHAFSESIEQKMDMIQKNVDIMHPFKMDEEPTSTATEDKIKAITQNDTISEQLTLGMYYSLRNDSKAKPNAHTTYIDPPNALCSIARLWSVTCSTSNNDDDLM
ncbi:hypothetical protein MAM1_0188c07588 [Mucor ambiguus]|uniref:Uncharacterized protein n=1 Tax=Mucor ambiguus TaxID=91626 RepID=A0A0C9MBU7_9FUNG|nr:hypothetical protein MAM1_0188c07588 [Mucor ambiguus]